MSKKQFNNRLKDLFETLHEPQGALAELDQTSLVHPLASGWSWEAGADGLYRFVSPECAQFLDIPADRFIGEPVANFLVSESSRAALHALLHRADLPAEGIIHLLCQNGASVPVRIQVITRPDSNGSVVWRGVAEVRPEEPVEIAKPSPAPRGTRRKSAEKSTPREIPARPLPPVSPGKLELPIPAGEMGNLLIQIQDDDPTRTWTEDERSLVMDVSNQLALALENARLYQAAQQELAERVRAEEIILHRNQDLAALNQIGQRLGSLSGQDDIFEVLSEMAGKVLQNRNLLICLRDSDAPASTPYYRSNGQTIPAPQTAEWQQFTAAMINLKEPLLSISHTAERLRTLGSPLSSPPLSLLAVPFSTGSQSGALVIQDFEQENAPSFDEVHLELISTAAAQAAAALENALLFRQMQQALDVVETRERYQAGVARAAANLSEFGSRAIPDVLKLLGQASRADRVYLLLPSGDEKAPSWALHSEWTSPLSAIFLDRSRIQTLRLDPSGNLIAAVREKGWAAQAEELGQYGARASLALSVPASFAFPGLLIFDQVETRDWRTEEIGILRVAADSLSNTFVRENLLGQLQSTLEETENLYNASNRLVMAADMQEMTAAVITGVRPSGINRSMVLIFEMDAYNKIAHIHVRANWYSGYGTPPPPVGTSLPRAVYEKPLVLTDPVFVEDTRTAALEESFRQALLDQKGHSLAILPLRSGKRQIGALLLLGEAPRSFSGREIRSLSPLSDQLTIAVENQRLFEQTQAALADTAQLYNISNNIAQASSETELMAMIVKEILPQGSEGASIILTHDDEAGNIRELEMAGWHDGQGRFTARALKMPVDKLPIVRLISDDVLVIPDTHEFPVDAVSQKTFDSLMMRAACMAPLRSGGRLVGLLGVFSRIPSEYDPREVSVLRTVANGLAVALEKIRLLRQAQRRALELQTASEIARDTTSTLSLDPLLKRIVTLLTERFSYYQASIFLVDDSGAFATIRESIGPAGEELKNRGFKLAVGSRSVVGTVTSIGEPVIVADVANAETYYANPLTPDTRSEIGLPLHIGDRIIGALDIQSREPNAFSADDIFVLGILSDQIAIAIENARAYELSMQAIDDMREVDRVKSQFLANMSHELRTPLNSIIGFSRVILKGIDGPITDLQQQDLSAIYNSGQHLLSLINDILDLSKIEAGKMDLSFGDVVIGDLINSVMSTAVGLVKDKPVKLRQQVEPDLPVVRADATRIRQVLINFLSNAAKFTDDGSITVNARRSPGPDGRMELLVTVTDTGPGIAENDQSKLFLPFSQVDDSPTRKTGGTGLGLSICRSLIEMHGGRIGLLSSTLGQGSTFFFSLPLSQSQAASADPSTNPVVLAIDDDAQVIQLYERYLQPNGYQVVPHTNPRTAVARARELRPFAITLDVMMPEKDGWSVMRELKSDPITREIPIVICSILEQEEKGFNLGAADYLVKPFLQDDLINTLARLNSNGTIREVLVVDDDPKDLRLVEKMLADSTKYQVTTVQGGLAGWEALQTKRPDALVLDLFMPDLDGFTLLANLRDQPGLRDLPVIVLTGADLTPEQHARLSELGQQLMTKGAAREKDLLAGLESALQRFRGGHS